MRTTARALLALVLLVGVYVFGLLLVGGLVALAFLSVRLPGAAKVGLVALVAAAALLRALVLALRVPRSEPDGVPLSRSEQPDLWREIDALAATVGTRGPDEVLLVPAANAAVIEDTRLMGLRGGRRTMLLGVPLLMTFTVSQVRAVLCHELGHYSSRHTRLGPLTYRGHEALRRLLHHLRHRAVLRWFYSRYAQVFFRVSNSLSRRQELEADAVAVSVAGAPAMSSALREVEVTTAAWQFYLTQYVEFGLAGGLLPDDLFGGFDRLVTDEQRRVELDRLRAAAPSDDASPYDTHPSPAQRLRAIAELAPTAVPVDERPGLALLRDPSRALAAVTADMFADLDAARAPWPQVVAEAAQVTHREAARHVLEAAAALTGGPATLETTLGVLEQGRGRELAERVAEPDDALAVVGDLVAAAVQVALVDARLASWQMSWSEPCRLVDEAGATVDVGLLVSDAVDDRASAAALRGWLVAEGVALSVVPAQPGRADAVTLLGVLPEVKYDGAMVDVVVTDRGLLRVPVKGRWRTELAEQLGMRSRRRRVEKLLDGGYQSALARPRAAELAAHEVDAALLRRRAGGWRLTLSRLGGATSEVKGYNVLVRADEAAVILRACLGERLAVVDRRGAPVPEAVGS